MSHKPTHFKNPFHECEKDFSSSFFSGAYNSKFQHRIDLLLELILDHISDKDISIYTGTGGTCVLLVHLYLSLNEDKYLGLASKYLKKMLAELPPKIRHPEKEVSFVEGYAGLYSLASVIFHYCKETQKRDEYIQKLLVFGEVVVSHKMTSNEILYGRAGYLHALLYTYRHIKDTTLLDCTMPVFRAIVAAGREYDLQTISKNPPLMYEWHGKRYLGFAHGLSGILYLLLDIIQENEKMESIQTKTSEDRGKDREDWGKIKKEIEETIGFMQDTVFPSGNYPSRDDGESDRLVQWCHGATGLILLFCKAYTSFQKEGYVKHAMQACNVMWEKGLLRKGYGLCHGISGNAYTFLATYKLTKEDEMLYKAVKFSEFGWDDEELRESLIQNPDNPYSLFEGIGGAVYLNTDLLRLAKDKILPPDFPTL